MVDSPYVASLGLLYIGGHPDGPVTPNGTLVTLAPTADRATVWTHDRKRMLFDFPLADVASVDVEQYTPDRYRGWTITTGFLGRGRRTPATSSVTFTLHDGTTIVFVSQGPPGRLRAELSPVTAAIRGAHSRD